MVREKILVIGASGQIGVELTLALRKIYGNASVIASDLREENQLLHGTGPYVSLDVMNKEMLHVQVIRQGVTQIYLLAAILSATGEKNPALAWHLNMQGLLNVLEIAREEKLTKVYWPSSIAVFGPTSPKQNCPQKTIIEPTTVYGISKYAGEFWCNYYFHKYHVDVRRATIELMEAPAEKIRIRTSYNISAMSFSPAEIAEEIKKLIPEFTINYAPDYRQAIATSWPQSIDDTVARKD